ncbi:hypothetical protein DVH24_036574 [Malus domestica]|uniref:F-box domain-containing protein n=1 Tax=Malus domestica TaxID=3750 RepID=A0A498ILY0_MALDO|nr:hypothetical protein DVH24_036574 [Malus domestica]
MVVEILSRLPPKSLMRFKCVQKSWHNLINSPSFVAMQLSNSLTSSIIEQHTVLNNTNITGLCCLMAATDGRVVCYNIDTRKLRYLPVRGAESPG